MLPLLNPPLPVHIATEVLLTLHPWATGKTGEAMAVFHDEGLVGDLDRITNSLLRDDKKHACIPGQGSK